MTVSKSSVLDLLFSSEMLLSNAPATETTRSPNVFSKRQCMQFLGTLTLTNLKLATSVLMHDMLEAVTQRHQLQSFLCFFTEERLSVLSVSHPCFGRHQHTFLCSSLHVRMNTAGLSAYSEYKVTCYLDWVDTCIDENRSVSVLLDVWQTFISFTQTQLQWDDRSTKFATYVNRKFPNTWSQHFIQ